MFYLTTHSTRVIYGYMVLDIWLRTTDSERGNMLPPHGLLFLISSKSVILYASVIHTTAFVTPAMEHWLEREIGQWVHHEGSI